MQRKSVSEQKPVETRINVPAHLAAEAFPTVRYFQIHFEFLQEQLQQTLHTLDSLKSQVHYLEQQLTIDHSRFSSNEEVTQHQPHSQDIATKPNHLSVTSITPAKQPRQR